MLIKVNGQAVFKVAAFRFDARVRHCMTPVSVTRWSTSSHADRMHWCSSYKVKVAPWKSFWANCVWCYQDNKQF